MSPIGRIFIVLNLILSAVFLAWASSNVAQSHDYKAKLEAAEAAASTMQEDLEGQISTLKVENDTKSTEADGFRSERDDATAARDRVGAENGRLTRQVSEASAANEKNTGALSSIQATLDSIETAKDEAFAARREAEIERDDALSTAQDANSNAEDLTAQNTGLNNTIADLKAQLAGVAKANSSLETQLATLVDVTGVSLADIASQELISASVLQAVYDVKPGLVALNVGSNTGVKRGYTFEIYNGSVYKGQVRVENVRDDMCTALIIRTEEGQTISSGDSAATRL
ncbi:MAG: cell division protein FtsB [Candidatus Paceibacteria bacterium]|jgi:cell division protein FtsB